MASIRARVPGRFDDSAFGPEQRKVLLSTGNRRASSIPLMNSIRLRERCSSACIFTTLALGRTVREKTVRVERQAVTCRRRTGWIHRVNKNG